MDIEDIKPGIIISGPKWPEPVEVKKCDYYSSYVHIVGATIRGQHVDQLIPIEELSDISIKTIETDFRGEPLKVFLAMETKRYRFASLYDPLLAMNASKVDPLPHQIEAVYGYILKLPTIRFLIADDPGAGKTIMAGLIIKEMKLRNLAKRVLIVVPGHLKDQWQRELKERFDETFVVIDRNTMNAHYGENVWETANQILTSMDFAKREEIISSLGSANHFDIIIVDEAHKMSAYRYGDKLKTTDRYKLGEVLSTRAVHLLFLTATPHRGDPENFRLFIDLLEPGFFADTKMLQESITNKDNPLFIRRIKEELKDFEGKPLFLPRHVKTVGFTLSDEEKLLYNNVSRYVKEQYNKALRSDKKSNVAFALVILQRRLASSIYALLRSLERRKKRLGDLIENMQKARVQEEKVFDFEETEELSEEERWKEEELWETLSVAENRQELESEISTIENLIDEAKAIIQKESEIKLQQLKKTMNELNEKFSNKKILIFTESRDTLEYLEKKIRSWGYSVNTIHGGMKLEDRITAEKIFKNETQVMVATEAAGEGINLQFCHLMINYDLPWNPNRLEQRMGRIHRYGQKYEVYIFNVVATDTREGQVLSRLFDKLEEIRGAMQSDKVFDVISEVLYDKDLSKLMLEAAASARDIDDILKDLDIKVDEEYIAKVKEKLGESLATKYIDYTRLKEMAEKSRENKLIPEYTQAFFKKAFLKAEGRIKEKGEFMTIESIPYEIRNIANEDSFKRKYGSLLKSYSKITFDKDIASKNQNTEFVSFGHPLFEAVLEWVERQFGSEIQKGATFVDPEGKLDGYILFYEGEIRDGKGTVAGKSLFAYYIDLKSLQVKKMSPTITWDLIEGNSRDTEKVDLNSLKEKVSPSVVDSLRFYMEEIRKERNRQAEIKEKYGLKSLDKLIWKIDGDLIELRRRKEQGENVDLAIRNKEEQKKKYEKSRNELNDMLSHEKNLTMSMPVFLGIIRVKPAPHVDDSMQRDEEVERIGMEIAMKYERDAGREPEDVSKENLGFDIKSKGKDGRIRYIEVKARAGEGSVALTQNEWFKAKDRDLKGEDKDFKGEYYLYVIWNTSRYPDVNLMIFKNPAERLKVEEKVDVVRYVISAEEIKRAIKEGEDAGMDKTEPDPVAKGNNEWVTRNGG